jgi:glutamate/tyrosine decarboxylase-like PLP-dependent enzyme
LAGIRHADSFVVDPHKWLFAPLDCAALIYREPHRARAVHTQHAGYLDALHTDDEVLEWNPSDYAIHLSRRPRGLALWFSLAANGTDAYARAIDRGLELATYAAAGIASHKSLELVREPELTNVLFLRDGWSSEDYLAWCAALLQDQIAFAAPSTWEGRPCGRLSFLHPDLTNENIDEVLNHLVTFGRGS